MTTHIAPRAGRREWIGLAVLLLPCLLISMDIGVLYFAVPFISSDLEPSGTEQLWIMDVYGFVLAGLLVTMGALGDRIGRRRLLLVGAAAFGVASLAAAWSGSAELLIVARAVLGLAGATLMPSTLALIRNMFLDRGQRRTAIAIWTGGLTGGATLGPIVGGFLMEHFWWGSAFLINVPAMILLLILGPILLPEFRRPKAGRFDLIGAALSLVSVLAVIYGIKTAAVDGVTVLATVSIVAGLGLATAFVIRQRRAAQPLIDVKLFAVRAFSTSILVNVLAMFALGFSLFTAQYLQLVLGMGPLEAALWSLAVAPAILIATTLVTILAKVIRPAFLIGTGFLVSATGFAVLTQLSTRSSVWAVILGAGLLAAGILMASTLTGDLILTAAPAEKAGSASALSETGSELGAALGIAILGSIGAAVYHSQMAGVSMPGVSGAAAEAAKDTLGGATAVVAGMPGTVGDSVLQAGREAFTQGMGVAATVGAALMAVAAVVIAVRLRSVPAVTTKPEEPAEDDLVSA